MQFDDLLSRYFGTTTIDDLEPAALSAGVERMQVDLGLSKDRAQRFALWSVLYLLGAAPDLDVAFADAEDRDAARNFMDLLAASAAPDEQ